MKQYAAAFSYIASWISRQPGQSNNMEHFNLQTFDWYSYNSPF